MGSNDISLEAIAKLVDQLTSRFMQDLIGDPEDKPYYSENLASAMERAIFEKGVSYGIQEMVHWLELQTDDEEDYEQLKILLGLHEASCDK